MDEKRINIPQKLPKEIADKFQVENNTLKREVKDNPKDRIEIEIGDSKQPDFKPQVKLMRWDNEVNFSLRAEEHPDAVVETDGKVIKYRTPEYEVHQYELDPGDIGEDGGLEFEWILPSKPTTNVLQATIQTKELNFFFQPPLTPEEILEGASRPEHVEGSYAVYHKTKGGMNRSDGMEYKVGKAFHIYRPKVTDANGNETWGELNIDEDNGILTVTVGQDFLDDAVYPVIVDPTFGYTSLGATLDRFIANATSDTSLTRGMSVDLPDSSTLDSISGGFRSGNNMNVDTFLAIYRRDSAGTSSHVLVASVESLNEAYTSGVVSFHTFNASSEALSIDTYILAAIGNGEDISTAAQLSFAYDTGTNNDVYVESTSGAGSYSTRKGENPWTEDAAVNSATYSIYATYTASGGGGSPTTGPFMTTNTGFWGS